MKRTIIETEDGSKTIYLDTWNETYHSTHGAVQEAIHVFIKNGFNLFIDKYKIVRILEMGLGTGLNAFITLLEAEKHQMLIEYVGIEKFPITEEEFTLVDYFDDVFKFYPEFESRREEFYVYYQRMFLCDWEEEIEITSNFKLTKLEKDFFDLKDNLHQGFDLVYFDAFGSKVQPELWEEELLIIVSDLMKNSSILTTYAAKGSLKRALKTQGFKVEKRPGPPGKREMMVSFRAFDYE